MQHTFVDQYCGALDGAERDFPFGPDTVVWKVNGHMFAAYTQHGQGLSVRTRDLRRALKLIKRSRPASAPYLTSVEWVVLPWSTPVLEMRDFIRESHQLVRRDWPSATYARWG